MEEFSKEKFYYDMLYIFGDISRHHPNLYYKISKEELVSLIKNYLTDDKIDTYEKSMNYLNEIFVKIGDSHTALNTYNNPLPIKFNNELVFTFEKDGKEYTYTDNVLEITPNYLYNDTVILTAMTVQENKMEEAK